MAEVPIAWHPIIEGWITETFEPEIRALITKWIKELCEDGIPDKDIPSIIMGQLYVFAIKWHLQFDPITKNTVMGDCSTIFDQVEAVLKKSKCLQ